MRRSFFTPRPSATHEPERELGIGVAEIGGFGVSVGRLVVVLGDAEPFA